MALPNPAFLNGIVLCRLQNACYIVSSYLYTVLVGAVAAFCQLL